MHYSFEKKINMHIWSFCKNKLEQNINIALMVIIETKGSSPGKVGFKMAVAADGELNGSIGGGSAEYAGVETAKSHLRSNATYTLLIKQVHNDKDSDSSGMICSGQQQFAIIPMDSSMLPTIKTLEEKENEPHQGKIIISPKGLKYTSTTDTTAEIQTQITDIENWEYAEPVGLTHSLYIFGGGHVSVELSRIMNLLGFYVQVFDNRKKISTMEINEFAHRKEIIDFGKAGSFVPNGNKNYVVIMTVGHLHDLEVLEQMVNKNIRYLGMMGSKSKVHTIHKLLNDKGFSDEQINKIQMPIGEPIFSQTPIEIAISIGAQIIKEKNKPNHS